jgi:hypothetical protein
LYARRHGSYETDATRNAIPTVWTWNAGDIEAGIEVSRDPLMKVGQLRGAGLLSTTSDGDYDAYAAEAGYLAQAQAPGRQEMPGFIAFSIADVQERVGHAFTNMNRPVDSIPVTVLGQRDVIEPALMEWHILNVDTYAPLEKTAFGTTRRTLPLTVARTYTITPTGVTKRVTAQFEPETKGKPAPLVPRTGGPGADLGDPLPPLPIIDITVPPEEEDPCAEDYGYEWCHEYNYTTSNEGFALVSVGYGEYIGSSGWAAKKVTFGYDISVKGDIRKSIATGVDTSCKRIEIVATHVDGQGTNYFYVKLGFESASLTTAMTTGTNVVFAWTGSMNSAGVSGLRLQFQTAYRGSIPAADPNPLGELVIHKVRMWGNGTEPTW